MSTIENPRVEPSPIPGSPEDPYRYGWRYVKREQPDGQFEFEQIPLTLEDLLFPEEGDFAVQFPSHVNDCLYLKSIFDIKFAGDPEAVVLFDCRVDWNLPGVRALGPDIAVFLGVPSDFDRGTLGLLEDAARPVLVVEVTSPDTRTKDFGIKKDFYHRAGVPLYVIVDARPGPKGRRVKLLGFRHAAEGYEPMPLDDRGRLWLEPMGLWLTIAEARVLGIDGETGEPFVGYGEQVQARVEAEARATAATQAQAQADAKAEAEAKARVKADAKAEAADAKAKAADAKAEAADAKAEAADAKAEAAIKAQAAAEARNRELEAELRRLRGES